MMRKIETFGVSTCFSEVMEANDPEINDYIIKCDDIESKHINWFKENAGNKRIRNIAKQIASSNKFNKSFK